MVQTAKLETAGTVRRVVAPEKKGIERFFIEVPIIAIVEPPGYENGRRSLSDLIVQEGMGLVLDSVPEGLRFPRYLYTNGGWENEHIYWRFKEGERLTLIANVERKRPLRTLLSNLFAPPARITAYEAIGRLEFSGGRSYDVKFAWGFYPGYDSTFAECLYPGIPMFTENEEYIAYIAYRASLIRRALVKV